ncbi:formylglycine-generating enzyme family protein [Dolichospermum sp. UHCC 0684]|jgi:formylglycine-generating enzyme required for sulfatase activity|uniref:formylglycine-generating enzyme family protein n=1 Tax=unclassified Dolichospermum TaxID=2622029 RepID=UPI001446630F|nr:MULTISPECIES: formylglycine-generating enzyme family protein [unclassified Dolichospermum]MEA5528717.1 formylglycine-generating enzyme family protein [Dolichospermum sp. UHCC 0684]MTJ36431.1 formylglycine-generating enzyme family protein [Dolichospermum sp. UHCC 0260]
MNKLSSHAMIESLIRRLDQAGLLHNLSLDDEDIADSIWLALQIGVIAESKAPTITKPEPKIIDDGKIESAKGTPIKNEVINVYPKPPETKPDNQNSGITNPTSRFPFQVPAARTIQNSLEIGRAMRPLKHKVPSMTRFILDEEATVNRIIERDIWQPVRKSELERWLNLELVVEESRSAFIWQELIDEFQQILENQGAFRRIRVWTIKSQNNNLMLIRRKKGGKLEQRQHQHRELIHPNKRGLTLLISDCVSPLWQNPTFHQWLKDWSESQPTAVVQFFPERLWDSTQLSLGRKLFAKALNPGIANNKLILDDLPFWLNINWHKTLILPVLNLDPQILKLWARVIAGFGNTRISTYLFDLEYLSSPLPNPLLEGEGTNSPPSLAGKGDGGLGQEEQAKIIVKQFLNTASLTAQRLAGMMAAAPVDISVVNLIRKTCLKAAQPVHVAEVYMGGLIYVTKEDKAGKARVYDFLPSVRKVLNQAMATNETINVLDAVSKYIGDRIGLSVNSFTALIDLLPEIETDKQKVLPFAQIAVDVFRNLGGEYAQLANSISSKIQPITSSGDITKEPELKTCTVEVATIEIIKTHTFDFVVATLERESKRGKSKNWVVKQQQKQGIGVIEELAEGVNLELMEIPGGKFLMGSPKTELDRTELDRFERESPQHQVTVSSFFMGKYSITQKQWREVAKWEQIEKELKPDPSRFKDDYEGIDRWTRPVERISWSDAKEFCARLSQKTGREYRLPTEAEWEYACRAGTTTPFHFGETITTELANYDGNYVYGDGVKGEYRQQTTPVGYFKVANNFGLYDMHGNVWEWCEDSWHDNYKNAPKNGSAWIGQDNASKVLRGGSWYFNTRDCRSASRDYINFDSNYNGFRVVRVASRT